MSIYFMIFLVIESCIAWWSLFQTYESRFSSLTVISVVFIISFIYRVAVYI